MSDREKLVELLTEFYGCDPIIGLITWLQQPAEED